MGQGVYWHVVFNFFLNIVLIWGKSRNQGLFEVFFVCKDSAEGVAVVDVVAVLNVEGLYG